MEELKVKEPEATYARWVKYVNEYEEGATLYEGFMDLFEAFQTHGIQQAIVSAKTRDQYQLDICSKGIDQYMDTVILYIGDALSDQQASCNAGIDFGYARWGSVSNTPLQCTCAFDTPLDLLKLL